VVTAEDITIPLSGSKNGLSEEDSRKVQRQFELMIANPARYLGNFDVQEVSTHQPHPTEAETFTDKQMDGFGLNMHTLGIATQVMGGIAVALGLIALCLASFGSPLMIAGGVIAGIGIASFASFASGFFVSKAEPKYTALDTSSLSTSFDQ